MTFIAGLRHNSMIAPMVIEGAMNGAAFLAYIEQILGPTLKRGDIVGMDTVGCTKLLAWRRRSRLAVRESSICPRTRQTSTQLSCLSAKFKAYLRKFAERTVPTLYQRVGAFVPTFSRAECCNYFRHAGYVSI